MSAFNFNITKIKLMHLVGDEVMRSTVKGYCPIWAAMHKEREQKGVSPSLHKLQKLQQESLCKALETLFLSLEPHPE